MAKKQEKPSGGGRLKVQGKSLVWVTFGPEDKAKIRTAAGFAGQPMSQFLAEQGLLAAEKILDKIRKQT